MAPIMCFQRISNSIDTPFSQENGNATCTLLVGNVYVLPVLNHYGAGTTPQYCEW